MGQSAFVHPSDYYATVDGTGMRWESAQTFTKFDIALQFHREGALI